MKKFYPILTVVIACLFVAAASAQNPGDTITVKTLNYDSGVRDSVVNLTSLSAGVYLVKVTSGAETFTQKVVKQ